MSHSIGDGIVVFSVTAGILGYLLLKFLERRRRLEILHAERVAAMDKGIPLPELTLETLPVRPPDPADQHVPLILGIVLTAFGFGSVSALLLMENMRHVWPMPLPVAFIGLGLVLYHYLAVHGQGPNSASSRGN